ncbi:hypothetical protein JS532_08310 [Bifidobacterium callimiconis]|nr:hypothetical protein [Bifidobacterium callimiconis]
MNTMVLAAADTAVHLNGTQLGISVVASIVVLILLVTVAKLHPFVSLLASSLVVGIGSGYGPVATVESFSNTFGSTMASVGILVGLGAMLGRVLMDTGAADSIVDTLLSKTSTRMIPWTMALTAPSLVCPCSSRSALSCSCPSSFSSPAAPSCRSCASPSPPSPACP